MTKGKGMKMDSVIKFLPKHDNLIKPVTARTILPEWYKEQDGYNHFNHPTIKRCMPVFDAMTSGYYLLSPSDIVVDSQNPAGLIVNADNDFNNTLISQHDIYQYNKYPVPFGYHNHLLRIHPMWVVQTPPGYSSLFINPIHNGSPNMMAVEGLIDTDTFVSDGHLSFFVREDTQFRIKKGSPIAQVIPIKRDSWRAELGTVKEAKEAIKKQDDSGMMVDGQHQMGGYKRLFHITKYFK